MTSVVVKDSPETKVGIKFGVRPGEEGLYVLSIRDGSPASDQTDLVPGLLVTAINGCQPNSPGEAAMLTRTAAREVRVSRHPAARRFPARRV